MAVYFQFGEHDILYSVINASPRVVMASGAHGWHGSTGISSSLSLYDGVRARTDVKYTDFQSSGLSIYPIDPLDTNSIDKVIFVSGSYPSTGSVNIVKCRNSEAPNEFQITDVDWYDEHFSSINGLIDYYSFINPSSFSGSYDFYNVFFHQNLSYYAPYVNFGGATLPTVTSSLTAEARIKPVTVTSSLQDFVIQSQKGKWKFYITGSTGRLAFTDYHSVVTSSQSVTSGVWQHVCVSLSSQMVKFYIDAVACGAASYTGTLVSAPLSGQLVVGAELVVSGSGTILPNNGYSGFMYESRVWSVGRSAAQVSSSYLSTIFASSSQVGLVHYARFNDGPLGHAHGFVSGSGALDYAQSNHGNFVGFNQVLPLCPMWHPSDDPDFVTAKTRINDQINMFKVVHIPSMFYGRQIATGSVVLACNGYANKGIVRVLNDDGRGNLYISGSVTKTLSGEEYRGARWNKVGNVFYTEGLIVITDPSLLDFGESNMDPLSSQPDTLQVSFAGLERVPTKVFMCRLDAGEGNASNNPTYTDVIVSGSRDGSHQYVLKQDKPTTWVSAVGIYNEQRKLVAVAKLASPIRKREKDRILVRLRMDF